MDAAIGYLVSPGQSLSVDIGQGEEVLPARKFFLTYCTFLSTRLSHGVIHVAGRGAKSNSRRNQGNGDEMDRRTKPV